MDQATVRGLIEGALARTVTFPQILATLQKEDVESYHVDFLRNECRFYARSGESTVISIAFVHDQVAGEFSAEKLQGINGRVQAGQASYADFVKEGAAAGCAYYAVYITGRRALYFGRDGDEYVQLFPGSR